MAIDDGIDLEVDAEVSSKLHEIAMQELSSKLHEIAMQELSSKLHQIAIDDGIDLEADGGGVVETSQNCHAGIIVETSPNCY
ncbi:hypothetical protein SLE2022_401630 [Rubroshorea leprosula]